jgi:glycosyltransferase involved in cell wall biosynthesis
LKFLFIHQNFPGQYLHILPSLLADNSRRDGTHEIVFMTEPNANVLPGIRKVTYSRPPAASADVHRDANDFDLAMRRAEAAANGARQLRALGFMPDIILGHHGWGELLNLPDVYPSVPILGYFEYFYRTENSDVNCDPEFPMKTEQFGGVRAKNGVNLLALALEQHGQVPTRWQLGTYPPWAQSRLHLLEEGVDLQTCRPAPARHGKLKIGSLSVSPAQQLITYVARNLEPYRGFHVFMRALPKILAANADLVVSIVGGDEISYGAAHPLGPWRKILLAELKGRLDLRRVHFLGKLPYDQHLALLQRSDAHVYLSYPFVASWSLREALACGCVIIGGDSPTVSEFITHDENGLLVPFLDSNALAETVLQVLEDARLAARLRAAARAYACQNLDLRHYLARYRELIESIALQKLPAAQAENPAARTTARPAA